MSVVSWFFSELYTLRCISWGLSLSIIDLTNIVANFWSVFTWQTVSHFCWKYSPSPWQVKSLLIKSEVWLPSILNGCISWAMLFYIYFSLVTGWTPIFTSRLSVFFMAAFDGCMLWWFAINKALPFSRMDFHSRKYSVSSHYLAVKKPSKVIWSH